MGRGDFTKIPNGIPSVEDRVNLVYTYGVKRGRIDLHTFVDACSTQAAKLFGLFPRKGTIALGSDADLVVYDPNYRGKISQKTQQMNVDYSALRRLGTRRPPTARHRPRQSSSPRRQVRRPTRPRQVSPARSQRTSNSAAHSTGSRWSGYVYARAEAIALSAFSTVARRSIGDRCSVNLPGSFSGEGRICRKNPVRCAVGATYLGPGTLIAALRQRLRTLDRAGCVYAASRSPTIKDKGANDEGDNLDIPIGISGFHWRRTWRSSVAKTPQPRKT